MTRSAARGLLILSSGCFLAWLSYLGYLAITQARPHFRQTPSGYELVKTPTIVLSRPQLLASELLVSANVNLDGEIVSYEVLWAKQEPNQTGIAGLPIALNEGYTGAGRYLVPLWHDGGRWRVTPLQVTPGFPLPITSDRGETRSLEQQRRLLGRIYPENEMTRQQALALGPK